MFARRALPPALLCLLLAALFAAAVAAQSGVRPRPSPTPQEDEAERVFTEEVRIPVFAYDERGRADNRLEVDDVLVVEDGVPQQVKSVRRIPASVLILLDTGGDLNPAVRSSVSRDASLALLSRLGEGDSVALLQFNRRVSLLQNWTTEKEEVADALRTKLSSGKGSRLAQALAQASRQFDGQPLGNRHIVLVSDGVETPGRLSGDEAVRVLSAESYEQRARAAEAVRQVIAAQVTVHVISYAEMGRLRMEEQKEKAGKAEGGPRPGSVASTGVARAGIDPTLPPGMSRGGAGGGPAIGATVTFDPAMRRLRKTYQEAMIRAGERLKAIAEETGGSLLLPASAPEMVERGGDVAREIGTQYVVTYRPKRPLRQAPATEYRRIHVGSRRLGLNLRARRGYVVGTMQQQAPAAARPTG
ncbi:MAG TPA: VWA domain-containing protein [Pyrinomonadaceae bacterium]|nr:VWA domain-containing protein [Pyrinomonadaceae bacterium]